MPKPYTIKLFLPSGHPGEIKIIDKMNWTGVGLEVTRSAWKSNRSRKEFDQAGVYILVGYEGFDDLPTIYIGQGDGIGGRIDSHEREKSFWDRALVFISSNYGLNRAHITWLECALIKRAQAANRCHLDNSVTPSEPNLSESEKADTEEFLNEILSILPLVELRIFEKAEKITATPQSATPSTASIEPLDTVVVPAQEDGFKRVFLGENCWYAIRIGGGMLDKIKYIAGYQSNPISAITHYAEVASIEPYGDGGKYKLNFKGPAKEIGPIPFADATTGMMQGPRYTTMKKLREARKLTELFR